MFAPMWIVPTHTTARKLLFGFFTMAPPLVLACHATLVNVFAEMVRNIDHVTSFYQVYIDSRIFPGMTRPRHPKNTQVKGRGTLSFNHVTHKPICLSTFVMFKGAPVLMLSAANIAITCALVVPHVYATVTFISRFDSSLSLRITPVNDMQRLVWQISCMLDLRLLASRYLGKHSFSAVTNLVTVVLLHRRVLDGRKVKRLTLLNCPSRHFNGWSCLGLLGAQSIYRISKSTTILNRSIILTKQLGFLHVWFFLMRNL